LLGLAVFLNLFGLPRSAALVGGLTLALMTMPVIVISGRNAVKSVPPSIREAALGIGASPLQVVFHHVLPLALPGILTGTIIGMARALGETAPLLRIGMRAFIATPPDGVTAPATVLPVQIFLWSDEVNRGFVEKTSAAIIVLLLFLLTMNALAIYLRNRFETRWDRQCCHGGDKERQHRQTNLFGIANRAIPNQPQIADFLKWCGRGIVWSHILIFCHVVAPSSPI